MKKLSICLALVFAITSCKKPEDKPAPEQAPVAEKAPAGSAVAPGSAAAPTPAPAPMPDPAADHITVLAKHKVAKPTDPVRINFETFKVVKADFDPKKIEGGKATIEIDLSSFHTDSDKRDGHVKSPAYLDIGKFATATIDIDNVKLKAGTTYTANAKVSAHGITKTYPTTFDVLETADDHVKIKASQAFTRLDFGVGTDPATDGEQQVASELTLEMVLTLKKS
jgi:polyisoprenoid-binding protein YceI